MAQGEQRRRYWLRATRQVAKLPRSHASLKCLDLVCSACNVKFQTKLHKLHLTLRRCLKSSSAFTYSCQPLYFQDSRGRREVEKKSAQTLSMRVI